MGVLRGLKSFQNPCSLTGRALSKHRKGHEFDYQGTHKLIKSIVNLGGVKHQPNAEMLTSLPNTLTFKKEQSR